MSRTVGKVNQMVFTKKKKRKTWVLVSEIRIYITNFAITSSTDMDSLADLN